ncbi:MAG: hypothetical protein D6679_09995 [Candidatus Hydrogenedentota bacterium]|nr:MAG: hypothetical protein D6679_09995 [Candidatus Hydrogenedentota bacterium]
MTLSTQAVGDVARSGGELIKFDYVGRRPVSLQDRFSVRTLPVIFLFSTDARFFFHRLNLLVLS